MGGTRWIKIDTSYLRNPKVSAVPGPSRLLHLSSILWTADQLTDGHVPARVLPELVTQADIARSWAARRAEDLVDAGLWIPNGDGWDVHDFAEMNRQALKANVERQRRAWATRQATIRGGVTP